MAKGKNALKPTKGPVLLVAPLLAGCVLLMAFLSQFPNAKGWLQGGGVALAVIAALIAAAACS